METAVRETVSSISRVHGWGETLPLPHMLVEWTPETKDAAYYQHPEMPLFGRAMIREPRILLNAGCNTPRLVFAHEVGHLLDHARGKFGNFSSHNYDSLEHQAVMVARAGATYQKLEALLDVPTLSDATRTSVCKRLRNQEIWARMYAQHIALRSGDVAMLAELETRRANESWGRYAVWPDAEFQILSQAVENVLNCWTLGIA